MLRLHRTRRMTRLAAALTVLAVLALTGLPDGPTSVAAANPSAPPPATPSNHRFLGGTQPAKPKTLAQVAATEVLPAGFQDSVVFSGLTQPTAVRFASDGRIFVAEKSGLIKVFSSLTATTPTIFADLRPEVDNYWDRGLLGMTLAPNFPTDPHIYVLYTFDAKIGGTAPVWNDACPTPPGPTTDGCVVSGRLSRLQAAGNVMTGTEQVLINDWCQQFPSHSVGDLRFGADGDLYVSGGDGASFNGIDYGQLGGTSGTTTPLNPCGDPPGGVGGSMTPPTAEGGALRSQSVRRAAGEPVTLNGSVLRLDPATGLAAAGNPLAGNSNANAQRIVAFGFRNPFRFTIKPGTNELWIGDVGDSTWEEIDRIPNPTVATVANGGWPCYEGPAKGPTFSGTTLNLCSSLYNQPTGLLTPYFEYNHGSTVVSGESCPYTNGSSISGMAFYPGGSYPAAYNGALVFADHTRNCIWIMSVGSNGLPNPATVTTLVDGAANPVGVEAGPGGDIFYVDFDLGAIHRVTYTSGDNPPSAVILPSKTSGASPLAVTFDGSTSFDPDPGDTITYSWDLDGDGTFGDATTPTASFTYTAAGLYNVKLRVTDSHGSSNTATVAINVDNTLPVPTIDTPTASLTYAVGDKINFSGHAVNSAQVALPAADLSWTLIIHHCPTLAGCHTHFVQTFAGVASGSFNAPDHGYPSYLELDLTATDAAGHAATTSVLLNPQTVTFSMQTVPPGLSLTVGANTPAVAPYTSTVIANSAETLVASPGQVLNGVTYAFQSWSDGGAATHGVVAQLTGSATYTATYSASSTTAYLSDLAYTVVANGWGPVEKDTSNGEQAAGDGKPITLNGVVYAKGLGAHAASDIRYAMNGSCTTFSVKVGVDDEITNPISTIDFQVFADGTKLADSGTMTATSATQSISVDVTGKTTLQLVVTDAGDGNSYDHADWANAQLTCGGTAPPPDTTPPTITATNPAAGATGVATTVDPTATFSEAVDPTTISTSTFSLVKTGTTTALGATVTYNATSHVATLSPTAALAAGTSYTATVKGGTGGVKDVAGNLLVASLSWAFTTSAASSTTAYLSDLAYTVVANGWGPVEKDTSNGEQAAGDGKPITLNGVVYAKGLGAHAASDIRYAMNGSCTTFSVKVGVDDEITNPISTIDFQVFADGTKLADSGTMTATSATQSISVDVTGKTTLQLVVTDAGDGNSYDHADWANAQLTCGGTAPPPDTTPPTITATNPAAGATGVATTVDPTATFSEAVDPTTISTSTFSLVKTGTTTALGATVTYNATSHVATLSPTAALAAGTSYTATVKGGTGGVKDVAGNLLVASLSWAFTTSAASSTTAYLSDLAYTVVANGWGPVEKDTSNGEQAAGDGKPITLNGVVYAKGLGAHAASDIRYAMNGSCTTFSVKVGVDDEITNPISTIDFQVFADGTKLADSGTMTATSATQSISVDVTGKTTLQLVVTDAGDGNSYDHADWANAQLTCGG